MTAPGLQVTVLNACDLFETIGVAQTAILTERSPKHPTLHAHRLGVFRDELEREMGASGRTNLDDALDIVAEIDRIRSIQRELKSAFAKSELDGGVKAAPRHPLFIEAQARLDALHDRLMMVI